jgi:segregation and condensation protein A
METDTLDNSYKIKTPHFEGPFNLLLHLVEKRKLFINDLSLAEVTEDYLKYLNNLGKINPNEASTFLIVASTLLLIKSKSLLPNLDLTDEEKGDIENLEERLRLYKLFNKLSLHIKNNFGKKIIFAPLERKNDVLVFLPDDKITKEIMMTFVRGALNAMPKKVLLPEVEVKKVVSIEEMLDRLVNRMKNTLKTSFREFTSNGETREEKIVVIVGFLAMLELVRQGIIHAMQEGDEEDIFIERRPARNEFHSGGEINLEHNE